MGFWRNVDDYLKFKGIPRKELALGIGIKSQTLDRAIQRDSDAKIEEGLKVCKFLKVDVSCFLEHPITLPSEYIYKNQEDAQKQLNLYWKYHSLIENCEKLSDLRKEAFFEMAEKLAKAEK